MSTPTMIWVLVRATEVRDRFLDFVDAGNFKEAIDLQSSLNGMVSTLKSFVQQYGAGCPIACEDIVAMKIPVNLARNLESTLDLYLRDMPGMAVGVGFNFFEAASACKRSKKTRKIELYAPSNGEPLQRNEPQIHKLIDEDVVLPTNLFDPTTPTDNQYLDQLKEPEVISMPGFKEEIQSESEYIKIIASQMGSPSDAEIQQAQAEAQQQQQMAQGSQGQVSQGGNPNAKSMLAALGKNPPKPNDKDENGEDKEETGKTLRDAKKKSSKEDGDSNKKDSKSSKDDEDSDESVENEEDLKEEIEDAEKEAKKDNNQALYDQLDRIKSDLPQIMGLAQKDPKAFKQSMDMVNKLLDVAKKVSKGEIDLNNKEDLQKTKVELNLPVGSRKGMKKKVSVTGKPNTWRSMKSGQLKDEDDGSPISVREYNKKINQKNNN